VFERTVRSVKEYAHLDLALINSADARQLDRYAPRLQEVYPKSAVLRRKDIEFPIHGAVSLLEAVFATGRKGLTLQRYKGLGEMNAEQLWETTLDTECALAAAGQGQ
jgi:DNA gyrase subunit B